MHCKSGADRAGFAAALYLLLQRRRPAEEAQEQLSWRYLHLRAGATGILHFLIDRYAADAADGADGVSGVGGDAATIPRR